MQNSKLVNKLNKLIKETDSYIETHGDIRLNPKLIMKNQRNIMIALRNLLLDIDSLLQP